MINEARILIQNCNHRTTAKPPEAEIFNIDLKLPLEGLEEPYRPWGDNPWKPSPEEEETPDPCSFTGPLAYLSVSHEEALDDYKQMITKHVSPEFMQAKPELMELLLDEKTLQVFVPKTWEGIKGVPDLEMEHSEDLPRHMKPPPRPVNPRIYGPAKEEFDRMMKYFYVKSESPIASPLVVAPKATKPFIRICGDYRGVNKYLKMAQHVIPNVKHELEKCRRYTIYIDLDATNAYHQRKLSKKTSELLSVQTVWGLVRPLFMPEGCSPAQGILMTVMKEIF
jgi:hypothetical protein